MLSGVVFLTWKDMSAGIPAFSELQLAKANSFRPDFGRDPVIRGGRASIEFFDAQGHRFQTPRITDDELSRIKDALGRGVPVYIRYGRWLSPFPSAKIFTVYQLEIDDSVVVPYERLARTKQKEQDHRFLIISLVVIVSIVAIFFGVRLGMRVRRYKLADNTTKS
jgi:hypothetical protein